MLPPLPCHDNKHVNFVSPDEGTSQYVLHAAENTTQTGDQSKFEYSECVLFS